MSVSMGRKRWSGRTRAIAPLTLLLAPWGCGPEGGSEPLASASWALSVCDEEVPSDRVVDGIPAYDQCSASRDSAIYSSNGVDTNTVGGDGWVRTQWSGGYQCTELANRYLSFAWGISWTPNGDAGTWCDAMPPSGSGLELTVVPMHGDLIVFLPGVCGADRVYGHVALVDTVADDGARVTIVEQNPAGRRSSDVSCAACFVHVVDNGGDSASAGAAGGSALPGSGGSGASGGASLVEPAGAGGAPGGVPGAGRGGAIGWPGSGGIQGPSGGSDDGGLAPPTGGSGWLGGGTLGSAGGGGDEPGVSGGAPVVAGGGGETQVAAGTPPTTPEIVAAGGASPGAGAGGAGDVTRPSEPVGGGASGCACALPGAPRRESPAPGLLVASVFALAVWRRPRGGPRRVAG